jgi:hypothetical protein
MWPCRNKGVTGGIRNFKKEITANFCRIIEPKKFLNFKSKTKRIWTYQAEIKPSQNSG